jgi:hypothetical protein
MRILIYKQTHIGDPEQNGCWGKTDCMGRVRGLHYDAVIGVGGIGPWPRSEGIAAKVTWVGLGPSSVHKLDFRGPIVSFKEFVRFENQGASLSSVAPMLARRIYEKRARYILLRAGKEHKEAEMLLRTLLSAKSLPNKRLKPTRLPPLRCSSHAA